jgi:hypothetical protein
VNALTPAEHRADGLRQRREMDAFLEANPDVPLPNCDGFTYLVSLTNPFKRIAEVQRVAELLGVEPVYRREVLMATRPFGDQAAYRVRAYVSPEAMAVSELEAVA